ncbi:hypothetical protein DSECCO2_494200 [anaerobic digester metagenome]
MDAGAVFTDEIDLKDLVRVLTQALQVCSQTLSTLLIDERADRHPDQFVDRVTGDIGNPLVGKDRDAHSVDESDAFVEVLDKEPVSILAPLQEFLYPGHGGGAGDRIPGGRGGHRRETDDPHTRKRPLVDDPARAADSFLLVAGRLRSAYDVGRPQAAGEEREDLGPARLSDDGPADEPIRVGPAEGGPVGTKNTLEFPVGAGYLVVGADDEHSFFKRLQYSSKRGYIAVCRRMFMHLPESPPPGYRHFYT